VEAPGDRSTARSPPHARRRASARGCAGSETPFNDRAIVLRASRGERARLRVEREAGVLRPIERAEVVELPSAVRRIVRAHASRAAWGRRMVIVMSPDRTMVRAGVSVSVSRVEDTPPEIAGDRKSKWLPVVKRLRPQDRRGHNAQSTTHPPPKVAPFRCGARPTSLWLSTGTADSEGSHGAREAAASREGLARRVLSPAGAHALSLLGALPLRGHDARSDRQRG